MKLVFWQSQFQLSASEPGLWQLEALRLRRAADHLFEVYCSDLRQLSSGQVTPVDLHNLELASAASLLYGLSLENLLKGIIVKSGAPVIAKWRIQFGRGSGHNLVHLASKASITLNSDEQDLLNRLTRYVEWAGRYPVAKSPEQMALCQKNVSPEWFPLPLQPYEAPLYAAVFSRVEALL